MVEEDDVRFQKEVLFPVVRVVLIDLLSLGELGPAEKLTDLHVEERVHVCRP